MVAPCSVCPLLAERRRRLALHNPGAPSLDNIREPPQRIDDNTCIFLLEVKPIHFTVLDPVARSSSRRCTRGFPLSDG
jgi:hypothetical protein